MSITLDETHDPRRTSWVESANGHADFSIQNLPLGLFDPGDGKPRAAIAIGDQVLDLAALAASGLLAGEALAAATCVAGSRLNRLLALPASSRIALRRDLSELLASGSEHAAAVRALLHPVQAVGLLLPVDIGDYTDFYAGIVHARTVGSLLRPDNPLMPNYKHVPIGYHGRASSIGVSGMPVRRPRGQVKNADESVPRFAASARLDYEVELGIWIGAGNELGEPIDLDHASDHIAGLSLLNDWSARDIQTWEYQPLGPFLAKNFASTLSPWIVTAEALAPFRVARRPRAEGDPEPLPYLCSAVDAQSGAYAIEISVEIRSVAMRAKGLDFHRLGRSSAEDLFWSPAQMVAHHTVGGCNLRPGDLLGTGTISSDRPDGFGSLMESTRSGTIALPLPGGEERRFLEDGDEIRLTARAEMDGRIGIGFGECLATILPARAASAGQ